MTTEQKAKAYDEALKAAIAAHKDEDRHLKATLERIFPELKESEDEKIRKEILHFIKKRDRSGCDYDYDKWIAWLEKQGEQKPIPKFKIGDTMRTLQEANDGYTDGMPVVVSIDNEYYHCTNELIAIKDQDDYEFPPINVKQNLVNKIESKFKVGDWVIDKQDIVHQIANVIENVTNHTYGYDIVGGGYFNDNTEGVRLWTINDAKDGDVLACPFPKGCESGEQIFIFKEINSRDYVENCIEYYCRVCEGEFYENKTGYMGTTSSPLYPATKEQRDTLFAKMKEAGYEWDAEKKELKKSADKQKFKVGDYVVVSTTKGDKVVQIASVEYLKGGYPSYITTEGRWFGNGTKARILTDKDMETITIPERSTIVKKIKSWSEEDELNLKQAIYVCHQNGYTAVENWLKSIKQRIGWKPSDEQIEALAWALSLAKNCGEENAFDLRTLYEQLKKLKGE